MSDSLALNIPEAPLSRSPKSSKRCGAVGQHEIGQQDSCQILRLAIGQLSAGAASCGRHDKNHPGNPVVAGENLAVYFATDRVPFVALAS